MKLSNVRKCSKCQIVKPLSEFYRNRSSKSGYGYICKICGRTAANRYGMLNREKRLAALKKWRESKKGKSYIPKYQRTKSGLKKRKEYSRAYFIQNREQMRAHTKIANLRVRKGKMLTQPCVICRNPKADAHHCDYSKPLEVIWFCRKHHKAWHRLFIPEN